MSAGTAPPDRRSVRVRLLWFVLLWAGGVGAVAAVGYLIKWALPG
ncbi:MAG: DUF2474 domain-containing protein [Alphaproteobacteria bacterium]